MSFPLMLRGICSAFYGKKVFKKENGSGFWKDIGELYGTEIEMSISGE